MQDAMRKRRDSTKRRAMRANEWTPVNRHWVFEALLALVPPVLPQKQHQLDGQRRKPRR